MTEKFLISEMSCPPFTPWLVVIPFAIKDMQYWKPDPFAKPDDTPYIINPNMTVIYSKPELDMAILEFLVKYPGAYIEYYGCYPKHRRLRCDFCEPQPREFIQPLLDQFGNGAEDVVTPCILDQFGFDTSVKEPRVYVKLRDWTDTQFGLEIQDWKLV